MDSGKRVKLTGKQQRFCEEYLIDWNGTRAAKVAGYSEKTAVEMAYENLRKPHIKAYINELKSEIQRLAQVSALRNTLELKKVAYGNIGSLKKSWKDFKEWDRLTDDEKAMISEITFTETTIGEDGLKETIKVKTHDKLKALDMLNKMFGWDKPNEEVVAGNQGGTLVLQIGSNGVVSLPSQEGDIVDFTEEE